MINFDTRIISSYFILDVSTFTYMHSSSWYSLVRLSGIDCLHVIKALRPVQEHASSTIGNNNNNTMYLSTNKVDLGHGSLCSRRQRNDAKFNTGMKPSSVASVIRFINHVNFTIMLKDQMNIDVDEFEILSSTEQPLQYNIAYRSMSENALYRPFIKVRRLWTKLWYIWVLFQTKSSVCLSMEKHQKALHVGHFPVRRVTSRLQQRYVSSLMNRK